MKMGDHLNLTHLLFAIARQKAQLPSTIQEVWKTLESPAVYEALNQASLSRVLHRYKELWKIASAQIETAAA